MKTMYLPIVSCLIFVFQMGCDCLEIAGLSLLLFLLLISPVVVACMIVVRVLSFGSLLVYRSLVESKIAYWFQGSKHACDAAHSSSAQVFLCNIGFVESQ